MERCKYYFLLPLLVMIVISQVHCSNSNVRVIRKIKNHKEVGAFLLLVVAGVSFPIGYACFKKWGTCLTKSRSEPDKSTEPSELAEGDSFNKHQRNNFSTHSWNTGMKQLAEQRRKKKEDKKQQEQEVKKMNEQYLARIGALKEQVQKAIQEESAEANELLQEQLTLADEYCKWTRENNKWYQS